MLLHRIYMEEIILPDILTFEWDEGNSTKSWVKHKVSLKEQEQAFFDKHKRAFKDTEHSHNEKIRCISARPMNRKEVPIYISQT